MPVVIVEQSAGRSAEQKREVAKGITDAFVRAEKLFSPALLFPARS